MNDPVRGTRWTVRTRTGSVYWLTCGPDGWRMAADNVPNRRSAPVVGAWRVQRPRPWPPVIGRRLLVLSPPLPRTHSDRVPGGGKLTSLVVVVERDPTTCRDRNLAARRRDLRSRRAYPPATDCGWCRIGVRPGWRDALGRALNTGICQSCDALMRWEMG